MNLTNVQGFETIWKVGLSWIIELQVTGFHKYCSHKSTRWGITLLNIDGSFMNEVVLHCSYCVWPLFQREKQGYDLNEMSVEWLISAPAEMQAVGGEVHCKAMGLEIFHVRILFVSRTQSVGLMIFPSIRMALESPSMTEKKNGRLMDSFRGTPASWTVSWGSAPSSDISNVTLLTTWEETGRSFNDAHVQKSVFFLEYDRMTSTSPYL